MKVSGKSKAGRALLVAALAAFAFAAAVSVYVLYSWGVFSGEREDKYVSQFYQEKENSLDGVVVGSSAAYRYWCPPEAFNRHGMAVYCYGVRSMPIFATKYYIDSILKTQDPEFIAIEMRSTTKSIDVYQTGHVRTAVNRMPNSIERTRVLAAFMKFDIQHGTRISKLPSRYGFPEDNGRAEHSEKIIAQAGKYKGWIPYGETEPADLRPPEDVKGVEKIDSYYEEDLIDLLEYCDGLECEVVFFATPYNGSEQRMKQLNYAVNIVEEHGYDVINMNNEEAIRDIGLDYSEDFYNSTHTNESGAIKVTDYLSDIFDEMYNLPSHRGDKNYESWEESYRQLCEQLKMNN
ncbi:MAG: hypothetical protein ACI4KL_00140 [Lentihominibacter sp.]